jgi:branched-chain amino acid transport system ATP-binding protein
MGDTPELVHHVKSGGSLTGVRHNAARRGWRATTQCFASLRMGGNMILGDTILETRGLNKEFKGFTAVNGVNLRVRRGSIHALIGPNGAGKTTCFNLLTKFLEPTAGQIFFNGVDITRERPAQIARRGIIRSFQISAVFPHLTVLQNVRIGLQRALGTEFHFWRSERTLHQLDDHAMDLLTQVGLADFADALTVELSYGRKRALEIATTLAMEPELMLLDEPTQGMGHEDVDRVTALIKKVSGGRTILMVEHNMNVIAGISDTITVLQRGEVLAEGSYADVSKNPLVMQAYMGSADASLAGAHA